MPDWPVAVLFDFDGVIVNSEPLHYYAFHEVLHHEQIEITEEEYYRELVGFDDKGAFKHVYAKRGQVLDPKTFLRVMTRKSEVMMDLIHRRQFTALPGAAELIRGLWRKYPLGIVSGALKEEIEAMLEGVSLRDCFRMIVAAEDVTVGKPDPSGYLLGARLMGEQIKRSIKPADCLVIEDAPMVVKRVRQAGFSVLAVASTYQPEKLTDANWVVKTLAPQEVRAAVGKLKVME